MTEATSIIVRSLVRGLLQDTPIPEIARNIVGDLARGGFSILPTEEATLRETIHEIGRIAADAVREDAR